MEAKIVFKLIKATSEEEKIDILFDYWKSKIVDKRAYIEAIVKDYSTEMFQTFVQLSIELNLPLNDCYRNATKSCLIVDFSEILFDVFKYESYDVPENEDFIPLIFPEKGQTIIDLFDFGGHLVYFLFENKPYLEGTFDKCFNYLGVDFMEHQTIKQLILDIQMQKQN